MKDTPILFSGPLVRSVMSGRKTMTRRLVVPNPLSDVDPMQDCPYGGPGDRLWVRETFRLWDYSLTELCCEYKAGGEDKIYQLKAHEKPKNLHRKTQAGQRPWRPSIHMPRWASRITLEITAVCAERLQQITEEDAIREGINCEEPFTVPYRGQYMATAELRFSFLWDSIYKKTAFNWDANPWVWVISFRRIPQ